MSKYPERGEDCEHIKDCPYRWCDRPPDNKCEIQKMDEEKAENADNESKEDSLDVASGRKSMKPDRVIKALRNTCNRCDPTPCCEFEALGSEAADLIEGLQNQLAAKEAVNQCYSTTVDLLQEAVGWADLLRESMAITASSRDVRDGYDEWRKRVRR